MVTGLVATILTGTVLGGVDGPREGFYHPQFVLPTIEHDRFVTLTDYMGRDILLVHFASW
jgi:hypothetical protein